jgi:hypothetical protein
MCLNLGFSDVTATLASGYTFQAGVLLM